MADEGMTSDDAFEIKSVLQQILAQLRDTAEGLPADGSTDTHSKRTAELIAHEELSRKATEKNSEETKKNTDSNKSLISTIGDLGKNLQKFTSILNKTQKDFGVSIAGAAKLQAAAMADSAKSFVNSLKSINVTQILQGVKNLAGIALSGTVAAGKSFLSGGGIEGLGKAGMDTVDKFIAELTKPLAGPAAKQTALPEEILEATRFYQEEFGVINREFGRSIAQEAKDRGLSAQQLVQARRVFATTAMGDLNKVASIQARFFDEFAAKGLTPKIALEAISKYSELIARNGTRFADSFARAAADAKKIGVDLGKVDQIGDNIIDNFENFLEGSAEMGAMGFNFDTTRLSELAETGSTADLFNELRSQLALSGKDITKLRRSERLALEDFLGVSISDMMKMTGMTPDGATGETDPASETNNLLGQLLVLLAVSGPVIGMLMTGLSGVSKALSMGSDLISSIVGLGVALGSILTRGLFVAGVGLAGLYVAKHGWSLVKEGQEKIAQGDTKGGLITSAAGGALMGTAAVATIGLILSATGYGAGVGIPMILGALGGGAATGAAAGAGWAYGAGMKEREFRAQQAEQAATQSRMMHQRLNDRYPTPNPSDESEMRSRYGHPPIKKADGGLVTGPGTSKSDSIPARLSNGEYVLNADAVKKLGIRNLDTINFSARDATDTTSRQQPQPTPLPKNDSLFSKVNDTVSTTRKVSNLTDTGIQAYVGARQAVQAGATAWGATTPAATTFTKEYQKRIAPVIFGMLPEKTVKGIADVIEPGPKAVGQFIRQGAVKGLGEVPDTFRYVSKLAGSSGLVKTLLGKVGGIMFMANAISKLREGDTLGAVEDVTKFLVGKAAAAGVATALTIPAGAAAVPTGGGSIAAGALVIPAATMAADMAAAHLVGKAFDMYRGRYRGPTSKQAPDSTSAKIPRMHGGGMAGEIKKDELPAILQRGEAVLSKLQIGSFTKLVDGFNKLGEFGTTLDASMSKLTSPAGGLAKLSGLGDNLNEVFGTYAQKFAGLSGLKEKAMDFTSKIPGLGSLMGGGLKEKAMGFASKIPGLGSLMGGGLKEKAMGFASKIPGLGSLLGGGGLSGITSKIPGLSSISNVFSGFKEGGVGGAIKSLAGAGAGKLIGGALGSLIPIPGVGTMLGSLAGGAIGKGIGKVGGAIKGLFGRKKPANATPSMFGGGLTGIVKQKLSATSRGRTVAQPKISQEMMQSIDPNIAMLMGQAPVQTINQPAPQVKVDTTGIEQKLNAFITALNNIQINMDGASVGKVLVNASDAATTLGLFRPDSRATF
jgi:hypothetical protein